MSDDLVKRLREDQPVTQDMASTMQCALQDEAADRIAELEAKLAKAVEALKKIAEPKVGPDFDWAEAEAEKWRAGWYRIYGDIARTTLAELKGEK